MLKSFRDLKVYQEAQDLAVEIEDLVKTYPKYELYLLTDQSRRASRSVPALIAEGWAKRRSIRSFQKYLRDAIGECNEMMTHLDQADKFSYIKKQGYGKELIERYDQLAGKIHSLKDNWQNY
jgi:four helix bundle protein